MQVVPVCGVLLILEASMSVWGHLEHWIEILFFFKQTFYRCFWWQSHKSCCLEFGKLKCEIKEWKNGKKFEHCGQWGNEKMQKSRQRIFTEWKGPNCGHLELVIDVYGYFWPSVFPGTLIFVKIQFKRLLFVQLWTFSNQTFIDVTCESPNKSYLLEFWNLKFKNFGDRLKVTLWSLGKCKMTNILRIVYLTVKRIKILPPGYFVYAEYLRTFRPQRHCGLNSVYLYHICIKIDPSLQNAWSKMKFGESETLVKHVWGMIDLFVFMGLFRILPCTFVTICL